ncbi:IS256 family transposase [Williamsoniiplasma lucivorax]|uniref:Mutator family transposase n=6 Tax=Williamsoniiplasma lucivorax TaxID=209274 RepID=A0A2S5RF04_9MOLU|nr:IS256 family transposase [Williamsoniiplasma lucivorax]PPE05111.1 transposase [Williamsoniiplasma lucivorax]PPE05715.1 transposase [Williamsoniiplasma lucivorax]PPE06048.1 transposase [Williamsoniiplasma lucivorax]PPE06176.1 transposase [Williamsoniiplasma lucivorax]
MKKQPKDSFEQGLDLILENEKDFSKIFNEDGLFKKLTKRIVERALNTEMDAYLGYEKYNRNTDENNYRNGTSSKTILTENGEIDLVIPRDRHSDFEPMLIPKHQRRFEGLDEKILMMYARGASLSDIKAQLKELYQVDISPTLISQITDNVMDEVIDWQNRPLEKVYPIVYFDCIVVKVRQDKRIINKAVYIALGINISGLKDVLGLWISENEGAKFWLNNFTDLKNRGVSDILITCSDNLKGFGDAIRTVFPETAHQLCIVHQIRNSLKFVSYKDAKELTSDLKKIYQSINEQEAQLALDRFCETWDSQYPYISKSWKDNWDNLVFFLQFPPEIRRIIYTTNAIESLNGQLRKFTKNKRIFPNDNAVFKSFYLAIRNIEKKWTMQPKNWRSALAHFYIMFEGRVVIE